jgi:hypothetical protein
MTPFLIALALQIGSAPAAPNPAPAAQAPAPAPSQPKAQAAEATPSPADTLAGLEETYRVSCGQTGILYYGYAELCESLRKQIAEYRDKVDREAQAAANATPKH